MWLNITKKPKLKGLMLTYIRYRACFWNDARINLAFLSQFNRCVTSQLIKWFSNFREFFYIQMERFARQAAREGPTSARERSLRLGRDTELYRILNMHYNKSNDYQVSVCNASAHPFNYVFKRHFCFLGSWEVCGDIWDCPEGVFLCHTEWSGYWPVLEEGHLQDHL